MDNGNEKLFVGSKQIGAEPCVPQQTGNAIIN